ncbi:hypothetical protein D3C86_1480580 [compost metagenome]
MMLPAEGVSGLTALIATSASSIRELLRTMIRPDVPPLLVSVIPFQSKAVSGQVNRWELSIVKIALLATVIFLPGSIRILAPLKLVVPVTVTSLVIL